MADDEAERPLLTEMAEKLRQARASSFGDRAESEPQPGAAAAAGSSRAAEGAERAAGQEPGRREEAGLQVSLRIDSLERRIFELRAALEDAVAQLSPSAPAPGGAAGPPPAEPGDLAAWIAFAAAAMSEYDDVHDQARAADQLLAEYRARRAAGGLLSGP